MASPVVESAEAGEAGADVAASGPTALLRQRAILMQLQRDGFVSVGAIAARFGVSGMTARRDLRQLVASGAARRTHGGAVPAEPPGGAEPSFAERQSQNRDAKRVIGRAAAALVRPGDTIGIDIGSTTLEFARAISGLRRLNVFTHSLRIAMLLADSKVSTYLPGGQVRGEDMAVGGNLAITQLQDYRMDAVFLGVSGIAPDGIYDFSLEDTELKRVYLQRGARVVVLADASKFNRLSAVRIERLERIDVLVTDRPPEGALHSALAKAKVEVIVAERLSGVQAA